LSDAGRRNTKGKPASWESELWSYLSSGDGVRCPIYESCKLRKKGVWCLSDHEEYCDERNRFIDDEEPNLEKLTKIKSEFPNCPGSGRIFKLVRNLAISYQAEAGIERLPVPSNLITRADDNLPIEVRQVPLKAYHGAIWRLSDCWMVHLNSNDTPARQRFTLYHEIFHILAHCKATPVFKKVSCSREGSFNELLADHFSGVLLLPGDWVAKIWPEVKDISRMAAIFDVPKSVMYLGLQAFRLI
jgi:hypothetical protein